MDAQTKLVYMRMLNVEKIPSRVEELHDCLEMYLATAGCGVPMRRMFPFVAMMAGERVRMTPDGVESYTARVQPARPTATAPKIVSQPIVVVDTPESLSVPEREEPEESEETAEQSEEEPVVEEAAVSENGKPVIGLGGFDWRKMVGKEIRASLRGVKTCTLVGFDANQNAILQLRSGKKRHGIPLEKLGLIDKKESEE